MGCACSREGTKIVVNSKTAPASPENIFTIKLHVPDSDIVKLICYKSTRDKEPFIDLVNYFFFGTSSDPKLDPNFISVYQEQKDCFEYYIQRLAGYTLENEENPEQGKMWILYINGIKVNLSFVCENNRVISFTDELELKYEYNDDHDKDVRPREIIAKGDNDNDKAQNLVLRGNNNNQYDNSDNEMLGYNN